jgi:hypothetical protein
MFTAATTMTEMESLTLAQIETSIPNCSVSSPLPFDVPVLALIRFTSYHASQQPCSRALTSSPTRLYHAKTPPCKPHSGPAFNVPAASKNKPNTIPPHSPYVRDSRFPLEACQPWSNRLFSVLSHCSLLLRGYTPDTRFRRHLAPMII